MAMSHSPFPSRRRFLRASTGASAVASGLVALPWPGAAEDAPDRDASGSSSREGKNSPHEFCTFTKALQHLGYEETSQVIADIGLDGVESPVRPGGHVEPARVGDDLPRMAESLRNHGLRLSVMTTAITEVSGEQRTEEVLRTAAGLGVERFRMGYYRYDLSKPVAPQLGEFRAKLADLVDLAGELGIKPVYQNHSGKNFFGAPVWDLLRVLEDFSPEQVGVAFDIGHATVEGAKAWPLHFAAARPWLDTVYVKEPAWHDNQLSWGPVGEGAVDKGFYATLLESGFRGPVSVHVEYLGHKDPDRVPEVIEAIRRDVAAVKGYLAG